MPKNVDTPQAKSPDAWLAALEAYAAYDAIDERSIASRPELERFLRCAREVAVKSFIAPARLDGYDSPDVTTLVFSSDPDDWRKLSDEPAQAFRGAWNFMHARQDFTPGVNRVRRAARRCGLISPDDMRDPPLSPQDMLAVIDDLLGQCRAVDDDPDANGYVAAPSDISIYRAASKILDEYFEVVPTHKALKRILKKNPCIRHHKPNKQRLLVHIGDWIAFAEQQRGEHGLGEQDTEEIDRRKALVDSDRHARKGRRRSTSRPLPLG